MEGVVCSHSSSPTDPKDTSLPTGNRKGKVWYAATDTKQDFVQFSEWILGDHLFGLKIDGPQGEQKVGPSGIWLWDLNIKQGQWLSKG